MIKKYILFFFLIISLLNFRLIGENNNLLVIFQLKYEFKFIKNKKTYVNFITLIPKNIPNKQKIIYIKYSINPSNIFEKNGNKYAQFIFERSYDFTLFIKIKTILYPYSITKEKLIYKYLLNKIYMAFKSFLDYFNKKNNNLLNFNEIRKYLINEKYIYTKNNKIKRVANKIKGKNKIDVVYNIYNFVNNYIKYTYYPDDKGSLYAILYKRGDCTEYSDLFVTLCRIKNIPARTCEGYLIYYSNTPKHAWAEFYLENIGWIPCDPTGMRNFIYFPPHYIYLSFKRNDEILDNYHFYVYYFNTKNVKVYDSFKVIYTQSIK